ncbi:MAG: undecaprenyl-diphosphate phosphatase [Candidatus Poribacteria bacterium]
MTHIDAAILGLVQGLTEFLPVSSSGHLVLAQHMLGLGGAENLTMDLLLHVATLAAVLISFRADIIRLVVGITSDAGQRRLALLLLAAMVPTGIIGLSIKPFIAGAFDRPAVVGALLVATGVLLYVAPRLRRPTGSLSDLRLPQALWIGLAQGVAVLPGVSRSGTTICAGMLGGMTGEAAARFSFLLAVLAIGAAMVLNIPDAASLAETQFSTVAVGMVVAFVSGMLSIRLLIRVARRGRFDGFAYYCWTIGVVAVGVALWPGR